MKMRWVGRSMAAMLLVAATGGAMGSSGDREIALRLRQVVEHQPDSVAAHRQYAIACHRLAVGGGRLELDDEGRLVTGFQFDLPRDAEREELEDLSQQQAQLLTLAMHHLRRAIALQRAGQDEPTVARLEDEAALAYLTLHCRLRPHQLTPVDVDTIREKQTPEGRSKITALVRRLNDEQFEEREAATEALTRQADVALPQLVEACGSEEAEVRRRARAILRTHYTNVIVGRCKAVFDAAKARVDAEDPQLAAYRHVGKLAGRLVRHVLKDRELTEEQQAIAREMARSGLMDDVQYYTTKVQQLSRALADAKNRGDLQTARTLQQEIAAARAKLDEATQRDQARAAADARHKILAAQIEALNQQIQAVHARQAQSSDARAEILARIGQLEKQPSTPQRDDAMKKLMAESAQLEAENAKLDAMVEQLNRMKEKIEQAMAAMERELDR